MYAVTVTFTPAPDAMERFLPLMVENARASLQNEPGCLQFDVCCGADSVFLYEVYTDRAAFEQHLASAHFRSFDAAVADLVAEKVVHTFDEVIR